MPGKTVRDCSRIFIIAEGTAQGADLHIARPDRDDRAVKILSEGQKSVARVTAPAILNV